MECKNISILSLITLQDKLHKNVLILSQYQLLSHTEIQYIRINESLYCTCLPWCDHYFEQSEVFPNTLFSHTLSFFGYTTYWLLWSMERPKSINLSTSLWRKLIKSTTEGIITIVTSICTGCFPQFFLQSSASHTSILPSMHSQVTIYQETMQWKAHCERDPYLTNQNLFLGFLWETSSFENSRTSEFYIIISKHAVTVWVFLPKSIDGESGRNKHPSITKLNL